MILLTVQAQVVCSCETSLEDELQLTVGDVVSDILMARTGYWSGILNGKRGHFPKDCVKLLSEGLHFVLHMYSMYTIFLQSENLKQLKLCKI